MLLICDTVRILTIFWWEEDACFEIFVLLKSPPLYLYTIIHPDQSLPPGSLPAPYSHLPSTLFLRIAWEYHIYLIFQGFFSVSKMDSKCL